MNPAVVVLSRLTENCPSAAFVIVMPDVAVDKNNGCGKPIVILIVLPVRLIAVPLFVPVNAHATTSPCVNWAFSCWPCAVPVTERLSILVTHIRCQSCCQQRLKRIRDRGGLGVFSCVRWKCWSCRKCRTCRVRTVDNCSKLGAVCLPCSRCRNASRIATDDGCIGLVESGLCGCL